MSVSKKEKEPIHDVDMDRHGISKNRLATTGVSPCIGFIVFLNNGEDIFIEHLSDISHPTTMNLASVREYFEDISEHIDDAFSHGNITGIIILGGHGNVQEFKDFQKYINQLIDMDIQYNTIKDADLNKKTNVCTTMKKINHYQQLFTNMICNDVCFNLGCESDSIASITFESYLDIIVDKHMDDGERLVVVVQRVIKVATPDVTSNILIGVLACGTLILEDDSEFHGFVFGASTNATDEVVSQTGIVGYVESLTDPSYCGEILVLIFPLIGNYGVPDEKAVDDFGIDTRMLTKKRREHGTMLGKIVMKGTDPISIPFQDQNKANLMMQVSFQVSKLF
ncbi:unnamed protein product [Rotaria sp. Silwood2]|nr:unnamed protein product [Rotaria sp. Silwood2]